LQSEAQNLKLQEQSLQAQIQQPKAQKKIELSKKKREILNEFNCFPVVLRQNLIAIVDLTLHSVTKPFTQRSFHFKTDLHGNPMFQILTIFSR